MPAVSIVVPVYKVEAYLRRCVETLMRQTLHDIEIILVDDGSPDGCPALCDQLAAQQRTKCGSLHSHREIFRVCGFGR